MRGHVLYGDVGQYNTTNTRGANPERGYVGGQAAQLVGQIRVLEGLLNLYYDK